MADPYSRLLEWRRAEATSRGLAKLPAEFYSSTEEYLAETRRTFETELRENPSGRRGEVARQTFQRASQIARDIVEARMTKLLSAAFQTSVGGGRDLANALAEEQALFDGLLERLKGFRARVAPYLEPAASGPAPSGSRGIPADPAAPAGHRPASASEAPAAPPGDPSAAGSKAGPPRGYVRILRDSRPIELPGETLELRKEDVVSLPLDVARLLVEGRVAEWIEPAERRGVT